MAGDETFTQLSRSFEEISREFARIEAGDDASETLIASAEYELEQIKKVLAGATPDPVVEEPDPEPIAVAVVEPETPRAAVSFIAKLRKRLAREDSEQPRVLRLSA